MILIFDTETSGLVDFKGGPAQPHLLQLAAQTYTDAGKLISSVKLLRAPSASDNFTIDPGASKAHGLTLEYCKQYGIDIKDILNIFKSLLERANTIVAYNCKFDIIMMDTEFTRVGQYGLFLNKPTSDPMLESTPICKLPGKWGNKYKWPKLSEAIKHFFNEELDNAHDALADVAATARIYFHLRQPAVKSLT